MVRDGAARMLSATTALTAPDAPRPGCAGWWLFWPGMLRRGAMRGQATCGQRHAWPFASQLEKSRGMELEMLWRQVQRV